MNNQYEQYQPKRDALERETNSNVINPFHPKTFAKSPKDKAELKTAVAAYKSLKENKVRYKETQNEILTVIADNAKKNLRMNVSFRFAK